MHSSRKIESKINKKTNFALDVNSVPAGIAGDDLNLSGLTYKQ